ncbi:hypothetical protein [uncultured Microbacterium sp.]|uniref:hypothetical protein n=1 Tax=uncultured Microbacterium sp. TaxID=191216 RepID=UPI0028E5D6D8|nr:hypothetical protein [uncultured Microbacterium sp.]
MATTWHKRGADPAELKALHSGVPSWMRRKVLDWAHAISLSRVYDDWGRLNPDVSVMEEYETAIRRPSSLVGLFRRDGARGIYEAMGEEEFLDFLDFLVYRAGLEEGSEELLQMLEEVLNEGGSEWRVGMREGFASLEKRVPEGVAIAAEAAISNSGDAGGLLAEAWHSVFGRSPDFEDAYEKAIKAVEEAGAHIVTPNNKKATLGTMVRDMNAQKDWKLDLPASDADVPVKMAEALWVGQESRHGGNGYRKPTQAEAEAAVLLAVPLVQWFCSGALARRP